MNEYIVIGAPSIGQRYNSLGNISLIFVFSRDVSEFSAKLITFSDESINYLTEKR
jgi:hypothetical protein